MDRPPGRDADDRGDGPTAAAVAAGLAVLLLLSLAGWALWADRGLAIWLEGVQRFCL